MEARRRARIAAAAPEYLGNLHFDWPYRSHWKLFVLSAGSVTFPDAGSCCAWCITSSTLNNQHQGRQTLAFVTMAIGKGGITPSSFLPIFSDVPVFALCSALLSPGSGGWAGLCRPCSTLGWCRTQAEVKCSLNWVITPTVWEQPRLMDIW